MRTPKSGSAKKTAAKKDTEKAPLKAEASSTSGAIEPSSKTVETKPNPASGGKVTRSNAAAKQATPKAVEEAKVDDSTSGPARATTPVAGDTKTTPAGNTKKTPSTKTPEKKAVGKAKSGTGAKAAASKPKLVGSVVAEAGNRGDAVATEKEIAIPVPKDEPKENKARDFKRDRQLDNTVDEEETEDAELNEEDDIEEMDYDAQENFEEPSDEEEEGSEADEEQEEMEEEQQLQMTEIVKERKLKKEQEIFVGGLDRDAVEEDIKKAFEGIGKIVEVRLHKDFLTNKNKGFAFVQFATKEEANRALSELKFPMIKGKRCGIAPSEDNDTLFLGNICNTWTKEAIKRKLRDYGVDGVDNITLVADTQNEGLSRGFAFLEFSCHLDAMHAYKRLQKPDVIFGHPERTAKVAFAEPIREPDEEIMAQVKSVFVDGLPPHWDEDRVKEQLKSYGEIERVVLARNMPTAKRKDFGFVNFTAHEAAVACANGLNNSELSDGKIKMKTKARLANPLPKTQAVKGGMRGGFRIGHSGIGTYSRFRRGFGMGRHPFQRGVFHRGRGFHPRGRGGGRFPHAGVNADSRGRYSFIGRGGRRGSFRGAYEGSSHRFEFDNGRRGSFERGHGRSFHSRRYPYQSEQEFEQPYSGRYYGDDSYYYGDTGRSAKRPFSLMEREPGYIDAGSRLRSRYDHSDPVYSGSHFQDPLDAGRGLYSRDYYGSDLGGGGYSSFYGGHSSGRGYYY
ncbi:uncharacterized protein LOC116247334 [Nymphaea colorata]|nr:uncharacterized protein LOC116247334 [Nymphaea colorata]